MGLHLPGASFVNPNTPLRDALTPAPRKRVAEITATGQRLYADRRDGRRAGGGQRRRRPACHRRLDQPHDPPDRDGAAPPASSSTWDDFADLSEVGAAALPDLPERPRRREPLPRRRRHGLPDRAAARRRPAASRTCGRWPATAGWSATATSRSSTARQLVWRAAVPARRWTRTCWRRCPSPSAPPAACKLLEGNLGRAVIKISAVKRRAPRHRGAGPGVPRPERAHRRVQARRAQPRLRGRGPLPGPARPTACPSCTS